MKIKAKINPYPPTFNPQNGGDTKREKDRERDIEIERERREEMQTRCGAGSSAKIFHSGHTQSKFE